MENKHTPGPWGINFTGTHIVRGELHANGRESIADALGGNAIANARLIAAAPDLLASAMVMKRWFEFAAGQNWCDTPEDHESYRDLCAAIAKAKGVSHAS